jgi:unsaturated chondroitin disaccharide hydrolase
MSDLAWRDAIVRMRARIDGTAASVGERFPHFADPATAAWTTTLLGDWTGGYWNAMLWLTAASTGDDRYVRLGRKWTAPLRARIDSQSSAKGLLFYYGAAAGAILCGDELAREIALAGAKSLAAMYNPRAGLIPTGAEFEEVHSVGATESEVDVVQIAALLAWASRQSGDPRLKEIAINHARRHIELCVREDGSICQSATFDPQTGALIRRYTHKGVTDGSTWARAQAWGMLGWALAAHWTGEAEFLATAKRCAEWWIEHIPGDLVAFWDFDDPAIPNTNRDTSATAIAAAAMLKIAAMEKSEPLRKRYREAAEAGAQALTGKYLGAEGGLWEGCYNKRIDLAVKHELIWGSYYMYETLHVLAGLLDPLRV